MAVNENDAISVIGESGCGKTTLLHLLIGLYDPTGGEILYKGTRLSDLDKAGMKAFRRNVQLIFQDPFNSLDPKLTVEETLREPLKIHNVGDKEARAKEILRTVELSPPEQFLDRLPKQLSGGEKQRVSIARALILEPDVILADEPVSMLDVSTQASILKMLSRMVDELDVAMVYISHDLSTVSYVSDEINVMYLGRVVEKAPTNDLIHDPKHPYSQALIDAIPLPDPHAGRERTDLKGSTPEPINLGEGCRFRDRCPERMEICERTPRTVQESPERDVACHLYYDHEEETPDVDETEPPQMMSDASIDGGRVE
jgi:peptide/nickel transport system ATP-binding protein